MTAPATKIMATLADSRTTPAFVADLYARGMRGVRINSAHVDPRSIRSIIETVRSVSPSISILMDTKGPEMRTTAIAGDADEIELRDGDELLFTGGGEQLTSQGLICVNARNAGSCLKPGDCMAIDDGAIALRVIEKVDADTVKCVVTGGGVLGSRKSVSVAEGVSVPQLPAVSERDRINIEAALECGIDMIAHSFVRSADDVRQVREALGSAPVQLFAKIECREALDCLEEIAAAADGLLVARGDLGAQIPVERVPAVQARIMELCRRDSVPSIISTQILQSMMTSPAPTRAEVSDIALGVMQGADWLLLTGETARGEHPLECVDVMRRTIEATTDYLEQCSAK